MLPKDTVAHSVTKPADAASLAPGRAAKVESGDLGAGTGLSPARDEIGRVALHLDHLLDQLQQRDRQFREWNDELNARVDERTWREDVVTAV